MEDTAQYYPAIWNSVGEGASWAAPSPPDQTFPRMGFANSTWSLDSAWFYYSACPTGVPCRIFGRRLLGIPVPIGGLGEVLSTQPMVALFHGKETLFFSSDRFQDVFYKPEVIRAILQYGSEEAVSQFPVPPVPGSTPFASQE